MKNKKDGRSVWRTTFQKKRKERKEKNIPSSTALLHVQVVKFCSSASSLVICLQVPRYICYLINTARKKKERKASLCVGVTVGSPAGFRVAGLGLGFGTGD